MILEKTSWPVIRNKASDAVVILPIAATEQHGPHMGVGTDTTLVTEVASRAEQQRADEIILCPSLAFGMSDHHRSYAGTISVTPQTYVSVLVDMVESIIRWPAPRICILNGHGGNITPGKQLLNMLMSRGHQDTQVVFATYWELAGRAWAGDLPMESDSISHAGEYETSAMLYVRPDAVTLDSVEDRRRTHHNPYIGWDDDQPYVGASMVAATEYITNTGVMGGDPRKATSDKGEHLIEKSVEGLLCFIDSFKHWPPMKDLRC